MSADQPESVATMLVKIRVMEPVESMRIVKLEIEVLSVRAQGTSAEIHLPNVLLNPTEQDDKPERKQFP